MSAPTTITDPWIERLIQSGHLAPGARGLTREAAARQYNEANALTPEDDDYLYTPGQAQATARDALAVIGIDVDPDTRVVLTDGRAGPRAGAYLLNVGQIEFAVEQHRLTTGESLSADALIEALPWE
ncbi:hypothetical protein GII30_14940 [Gordonia amarae]|uniref:Uncharacterized protein n=2 Tax=Gordonia amarae TaxID=36821 RepID=G7GJX8_9ACTN|nr:hypothetical protein [Gordonia amarae]MCS3879700.1 hypothetical protein [Gordonia amarae]QHN18140.1 hypothetical protein GII35_15255 [Gordonia amarae]QHN31528.1 hypothetical protein GII32_15105 [Gordonia amarae]QHN40271.1 hypothetical protein GII30_14940 [Gordonia amarae]GAB03903.1 hypothetical protein GOAMR_06_01090 [Gordonia amarae NBRC 15530]